MLVTCTTDILLVRGPVLCISLGLFVHREFSFFLDFLFASRLTRSMTSWRPHRTFLPSARTEAAISSKNSFTNLHWQFEITLKHLLKIVIGF